MTREHIHECDVLVVGGGAAGLAAALQLGRVRRRVVVVDSGHPRNEPAQSMHGYLGYDGAPPADLLAAGRREVAGYGAHILDSTVTTIEGSLDQGFLAGLANGTAVSARRVLIATGVSDALPDIPGVADLWGTDVVHCPSCHGWEIRDQSVVVVVSGPAGVHQARMFRQLTDRLSVVTHGDFDIEPHDRFRLGARGIAIVPGPVSELTRDGEGRLTGVRTAAGETLEATAVVVAPRSTARTDLLEALGVSTDDVNGIGHVATPTPGGRTDMPGIYIAGDVSASPAQVARAAADGAHVGSQINADLVEEEFEAAIANLDWDAWYTSHPGQRWSGRPNATLVREVDGLDPGRALDIGCGEGGDAIWLASRGWAVTAIDISTVAVDRGRAEAAAAGVDVSWRVGDVDGATAEPGVYDLVTMHYPALLRDGGAGRIEAILSAVRPGGTLLTVFHALREPEEARRHGFDPDDYIQLDDMMERLDDGWQIVTLESRPRTPAQDATPHTHDTVLRARRAARRAGTVPAASASRAADSS